MQKIRKGLKFMKCCICKKNIIGNYNNAEPIKKGWCCDECNMSIVIPHRVKDAYKPRFKGLKTWAK